jgi:MoxR-like ATPase
MADDAAVEAQVRSFAESFGRVKAEMAKVIVGQEEALEGALVALLAGGHVLLEGLPGLGKTRLVKTLAGAVDLTFRRIQFTPDLMPADAIGTTILQDDERGRRFEFQPGPVFTHVLLADEINRATPKTQSALLEAMQESSVTVAGVTHPLEPPFLVLATQNPIELEGTYPLPEAQLDRFLLKLMVDCSSLPELVTILERTTGEREPEPGRVATREQVIEMRELVRRVPAATPVMEHAGRLVLATHPKSADAPAGVKSYIRFGASPRAAQALLLCAKVYALTQERYHVSMDDVRRWVKPALRHRLILNYEGEAGGMTADRILDDVLAQVGAS